MAGKILIVDDEPHIRELVKFSLEREGFTTVEAEDGLSCLELVSRDKPDLIILDIMLPGKDGLEVCRVLKTRPETAGIAVIMLTARSRKSTKSWDWRWGPTTM